jgi:hypothetical protein
VSLCAGSAYIFALSGGVGSAWTQIHKLVAADGGAADQFGRSISLSGDLLAVGSVYDDNEKGINAGGHVCKSYIYVVYIIYTYIHIYMTTMSILVCTYKSYIYVVYIYICISID